MKKEIYLKNEVLKFQPGGDGDEDSGNEEGNDTGESGKLL